MKRWGLLAAAALLSIGTALAEEEPSRHIRTTISGEAMPLRLTRAYTARSKRLFRLIG